MPSPTLLGLPIELRRQILQDAFLVSCSPGPCYRFANPFGLQIYFASSLPSPVADPVVYGGWGREPMSRIMRINRQLHSEAVKVLYGGPFVFEFCNTTRADHVRFWLDVLGEKKRMVKHIGVSVVVDLALLSVIGGPHVEAAKAKMEVKREAWSILREELDGLQSVRVQIDFVRTIKGGLPGRERLLGVIMGLLKVFQGVENVHVEGNRMFEDRVSILDTCIEKVKSGDFGDG